jgi:putative membrane protein
MRKSLYVVIAALVVTLSLASCKKNEPATDTGPITATVVDTTPTGGTVVTATIFNDPDKAFVLDASAAVLAELEYARTAEGYAENAGVKAFAHLLVQDLEREERDLTNLAKKHNVDLPVAAAAAAIVINDRLKTLKGKNFDETFLKQVIDDHTAMITAFDTEAKIVADDDLKKWVQDYLPLLHNHLTKANELLHQLGGKK